MMMFEDSTTMTMERWLDEAATMAMVCMELIDRSDEMDPTVGLRAVGMAAATIWRITDGRPSWGELDVEELRRVTRQAGMDEAWQDIVLVVVAAFYGFLEQNGLEDREQTWPILEALKPYVEPATDRLTARIDAQAREEMAPAMLN